MNFKFGFLLLALALGIALCDTVNAQNASRIYVEPDGWSIGTNISKTDLLATVGPQSFSNLYTNSKYLDHPTFLGGMFGRYTIHPCLAVRLMVNYGTLYATDKTNKDLALKDDTHSNEYYLAYARDQTVKSIVWDNAVYFEFMPKRLNPESKSAHKRGQYYLVAGASALHFQPYATIGDTKTWVKTYDLHLEGEGWGGKYPPNYSRWTWTYAYGLGYKWDIGQHLNLGFEVMFHKTHTSYIDGMGESNYVDPKAYQVHLSPENAALAAEIADKHYILGLEPQATPGTPRGLGPNGNVHYVDAFLTYGLTFYYKINVKTREWWKL